MTTLTQIAPFLDRLFAQSSASDAAFRAQVNQQYTHDEIDALVRSADYIGLYTRLKDSFLAVSRETAHLLYLLARSSRAKHVVEFGTSFGVSTIHLAAAVRDNGGGRVIGSEFEPGKVAQARANLAEAGLADLVDVRAGDALETLARDLPAPVDLLLLDGAKPLYARILPMIPLRSGALVVADNADNAPDYLAIVRGAGWVSVPFADDVELSMKL